ncbi:indole-3-acetaldehyde oxidase [Plakobranchus ocellatus]|uniref:Indole-3-acetaldehyde oxidase n=1 Tax=Plakobranchus ocellatus TaxID=259542 RepID=A0AAV4CLK0_9GAST|nr:indole-3-acetaldehyde oxidase [Plakobranchus ocellatus]
MFLVWDAFPASTSLNDYIREVAGLSGTKVMCKEAGCGCCAVTVTHATDGGHMDTMTINSDLNKHLCPKTGEPCRPHSGAESCSPGGDIGRAVTAGSQDVSPTALELNLRDSLWYRPVTMADLGNLLQRHKTQTVKMIFGNTASGIFKYEGPFGVYIDLKSVKELHLFQDKGTSLVFGAGTTITRFRRRLIELKDKPGFHYFPKVVRHLNVLASTLVRNAGSVGGNLMIKHRHPSFPSDLFTILEAIGARVHIFDSEDGTSTKYSLTDFLRTVDMKLKMVAAIELPSWAARDHFWSYKITPRSQVHAEKTEAFLEQKVLDEAVIREALKVMYDEIEPDDLEVGGSPHYRRQLSVNLLYKTFLEVYQPANESLQSGTGSMERPLSSGLQTYQQKTDMLPIGEAMPKKTAPLQASGEAKYTNDMPFLQDELKAAFVMSDVAKGKIVRVDTSEAMKIPGVLGFVGTDDIPSGGINNVIPINIPYFPFTAELFAAENVDYAGKPIGLVLAETQALAEEASRSVKVTYRDVERPVLDMKEAIEKNMFHSDRWETYQRGDALAALEDAAHIAEGECEMGSQYHFMLENQVALCVPCEEGMDVYSATQCSDIVQRVACQVTNKPMNYFNVLIHRLGGAFGGKVLPSSTVAAAAIVAAEATGRPVRLNLDLSTNMNNTNKRSPLLVKYKAGCDRNGKLVAIYIELYLDAGNQPMFEGELLAFIEGGYYSPNFTLKCRQVRTDKLFAGTVRAPGQVPSCLVIETVLEHLAKQAQQDPVMLREINLIEEGQHRLNGTPVKNCTMRKVWDRLKQTADVNTRQGDVDRFNKGVGGTVDRESAMRSTRTLFVAGSSPTIGAVA